MSAAGSEVSVDEEIARVEGGTPHVVILGAGASRAACPRGDATGKPLPVMNDFVELLDLAQDFPQLVGRNFEEVYSELALDPNLADVCRRLETRVHEYFSSLELPQQPNIYDHLVLSLRPKDVIATFNWDPFLVQAVRRCYRRGNEPPQLVFLHGNVMAGHCMAHKRIGPPDMVCSVCGNPFTPSKLLYPVAKKDYASDPLIAEAWRFLEASLKRAFMVTIFGYGAPRSDAEAVDLLKRAWGNREDRQFEEIEMIDIRPEDELAATWDAFIHTHHYSVHADFYDSFIANHPRRTGEAYLHQFLEAKWINLNPVPRDLQGRDLWDWYRPLREAEARAAKAVDG